MELRGPNKISNQRQAILVAFSLNLSVLMETHWNGHIQLPRESFTWIHIFDFMQLLWCGVWQVNTWSNSFSVLMNDEWVLFAFSNAFLKVMWWVKKLPKQMNINEDSQPFERRNVEHIEQWSLCNLAACRRDSSNLFVDLIRKEL